MYAYWKREYNSNQSIYSKIFENYVGVSPDNHDDELESLLTSRDVSNRKYAVTCASATDALVFSLVTNDIGAGDEVLVTNFSWISSASCVAIVGATPVFCDIGENSHHVTLESLKTMKSSKTKAVILTHLFGAMAEETAAISEWCIKEGLILIEDAAQAIGSRLDGAHAGSIGQCSSYSFNSNKTIPGISGGGVFLTDSEKQADRAKMLRRHGRVKGGNSEMLGINSKMYMLNAKIIQHRLERLHLDMQARTRIAEAYDTAFMQKTSRDGMRHNYHKYTIQLEDKEHRKFVMDSLKSDDMRALQLVDIHYDRPLSAHKMWEKLPHKVGPKQNATKLSERIMTLPIHAYMYDEEVEYIIEKVKKLI